MQVFEAQVPSARNIDFWALGGEGAKYEKGAENVLFAAAA